MEGCGRIRDGRHGNVRGSFGLWWGQMVEKLGRARLIWFRSPSSRTRSRQRPPHREHGARRGSWGGRALPTARGRRPGLFFLSVTGSPGEHQLKGWWER